MATVKSARKKLKDLLRLRRRDLRRARKAKAERTRVKGHTATFWYWRARRALKRIRQTRKKIRYLKRHPSTIHHPGGLTTLPEGIQVCDWLANAVKKVRANPNNRWHSHVISGWRSKAYSQSLCRRICGANSCPGICAGAGSRHSEIGYHEGAMDLLDPFTFAAELRRNNITDLHHNLPRDPNHFSYQGN